MVQPTAAVHSETPFDKPHSKAAHDMSTVYGLAAIREAACKPGLWSAVLRVPAELTLDQQVHCRRMMAVVFQHELFLVAHGTFMTRTANLEAETKTLKQSLHCTDHRRRCPRERDEVREPRDRHDGTHAKSCPDGRRAHNIRNAHD